MITHIGRYIMLAMWRSGISGDIYIGNPANCDTRTIGYQPAGVDRWMIEVDDLATGVLEGSQPSPTRFASFAKKEPVPERGARGVKRGALRLLGGRTHGGRAPTPPHSGRREHADPGYLGFYDHGDPLESPELDFPTLDLGLTPPVQSHLGGSSTLYIPPPLSIVGSSFQLPSPPGTADEHDGERTDDVTLAQQLRFGHRVVVPSFYVFKVFL
ncbi:hypothetical protein M9H77_31574 [Catharanthus roseus]|uniref:Uncharacterized protein n=1 Tax=Catharanthus roseus TaxID=4058 RepID=A0ACC0A0H6_CATRO|nr:hypothetical protein M9H77_31574 [Catharanthus roseus]